MMLMMTMITMRNIRMMHASTLLVAANATNIKTAVTTTKVDATSNNTSFFDRCHEVIAHE